MYEFPEVFSEDQVKFISSSVRRYLFGLKRGETTVARRGFRGLNDDMRARLEKVGSAFVTGYHLALEHGQPRPIAPWLQSVEAEFRGFAFEGAAMGLALLDCVTPWCRDRVAGFLEGPGHDYAYLIHVGVGWAWARVPVDVRRAQARLDPVLGWLAFDGWGFHEGFFHWPKYLAGQARPKRLRGYQTRVFDQGLGRSLWFVNGGNVALIARTISEFDPERRADLWSGLGLAATYAGGASNASLDDLWACAGCYSAQLAQGAAFAAKARQRAGNLTEYTDRATTVLCGISAEDAARLTDATLENLPADAAEPAYEIWRRRLQAHFQRSRKIAAI